MPQCREVKQSNFRRAVGRARVCHWTAEDIKRTLVDYPESTLSLAQSSSTGHDA